jgi:hypothetical protein
MPATGRLRLEDRQVQATPGHQARLCLRDTEGDKTSKDNTKPSFRVERLSLTRVPDEELALRTDGAPGSPKSARRCPKEAHPAAEQPRKRAQKDDLQPQRDAVTCPRDTGTLRSDQAGTLDSAGGRTVPQDKVSTTHSSAAS